MNTTCTHGPMCQWCKPTGPSDGGFVMNTKNVLLRAADLLEREGWCQGTGHRLDGARCMGAAIEDLANPLGNEFKRQTWDLVERIVGVDSICRSLTGWNDASGRTAEEVIGKLREIAEIL